MKASRDSRYNTVPRTMETWTVSPLPTAVPAEVTCAPSCRSVPEICHGEGAHCHEQPHRRPGCGALGAPWPWRCPSPPHLLASQSLRAPVCLGFPASARSAIGSGVWSPTARFRQLGHCPRGLCRPSSGSEGPAAPRPGSGTGCADGALRRGPGTQPAERPGPGPPRAGALVSLPAPAAHGPALALCLRRWARTELGSALARAQCPRPVGPTPAAAAGSPVAPKNRGGKPMGASRVFARSLLSSEPATASPGHRLRGRRGGGKFPGGKRGPRQTLTAGRGTETRQGPGCGEVCWLFLFGPELEAWRAAGQTQGRLAPADRLLSLQVWWPRSWRTRALFWWVWPPPLYLVSQQPPPLLPPPCPPSQVNAVLGTLNRLYHARCCGLAFFQL